jgi:hypothetical protein
MTICGSCYRRIPYGSACPHCNTRSIWQFVGVALLWLMLFVGVGVVAICSQGCTAGGARKAIVAASQAAELAADATRKHCRHLATTGCKTNPCPKLKRCQLAERLIVDGAASLTAGLKAANEVIDD